MPAPGVLANDSDAEDDELTATAVSSPANGTLDLRADGSFFYEHDGGETTGDSFTYVASDGVDESRLTTVTITINPVNDLPVAVDDAYSVNQGGTITVPAAGVLANDKDAEGNPLAAELVGDASSGTLNLRPDGSFSYEHDGSQVGSDSFTYTASDGTGDSDVAEVTIRIISGVLVVTKTGDTNDGVCDADCSLREAIAQTSPGSKITFEITGTITLTIGELTVDKDLSIEGPGAENLAISGNDAGRVFHVTGGEVEISGVNIRDGRTDGFGGSILNEGGTLSLTDSAIVGNAARGGGGIYNAGTLTVTDSIVVANEASGIGGGINNEGTLTITGSDISTQSTRFW